MTRPLIQIDDEIREMNDTEFAQYEASQAADAARATEAAVKTEAKAVLLARLGITAEEAALLLGGN